MYNLKPMSEPEKYRLIEIEFYLFIKCLLDNYNYSNIVRDIVEQFANLFGCNITIMHALIYSIYEKRGVIIPDKEELNVLLYKSGVTVRAIRKRVHTHPQTLYRILTLYKQAGQLEFRPKLKEDVFEEVKKFMLHLERFMGWRQ